MFAPVPQRGISVPLIEGSLTLITVAVAFCYTQTCAGFFTKIEHTFGRLARMKKTSVASCGLIALFLRLALLPLFPIPKPFVPDDFSFLLAANTFASGHLTNPTPAMWTHFESIHITMRPSYMSMYFPAQGLALAAGKLLTGHPWFGNLLFSCLLCSAICWMLQAWLPPSWALLGGLLAVLRLGLFSYWVNSYFGAGGIAGVGGALVLGALPRIKRQPKWIYFLLMAVGILMMATSRPYEGLLLCIPVAIALGCWFLYGTNTPSTFYLVKITAIPLAMILAALSFMAYYDYRAFGNPFTPPYSVDRQTYAMAPYFVWQAARPAPVYRHAVMRRFYYENELDAFTEIHSRSRFIPYSFLKFLRGFLFFGGLALLPPVIMLRRVLLDRRIRFLLFGFATLATGMVIQIFLIPHYLAPFTCLFYALGLQAMRHLRVWESGGQPVGRAMVRFTVLTCVVMAGVRLFSKPLNLDIHEWPASSWSGEWYGPDHFGIPRAETQTNLEHLPGRQLVIVRYSPSHNPLDEWVYNDPDIDNSKVIWAREMDPANNLELIRYYNDRKVWLVQPDLQPTGIAPYPIPNESSPDPPPPEPHGLSLAHTSAALSTRVNP